MRRSDISVVCIRAPSWLRKLRRAPESPEVSVLKKGSNPIKELSRDVLAEVNRLCIPERRIEVRTRSGFLLLFATDGKDGCYCKGSTVQLISKMLGPRSDLSDYRRRKLGKGKTRGPTKGLGLDPHLPKVVIDLDVKKNSL